MNKVEQRIHGDEGDLLVEATHLIGHLMDLCKVRDDYHGNGIIDAAYTFLVQRELQGDLSGVCDCEGNASCTRDELECYIVCSRRYTVSESGLAKDILNASEIDLHDVDEYRCANCTDHWPVSDKYNDVARAEAWQKALGHLKQDALDVTAIS
ncbi:MAG TPA: hypothetical protein VGX23_29930 [Actinocrinis sp.]|nr:hypothetical protein [Actinocrinis sp.]